MSKDLEMPVIAVQAAVATDGGTTGREVGSSSMLATASTALGARAL